MGISFKLIMYTIMIGLFFTLWITNLTKSKHNFRFFYINIINFYKLVCNLQKIIFH